MKRHSHPAMILVALAILFSGLLSLPACKKDEPAPEKKSRFSVAGQEFDLSKGYLLYWGLNSDSLSADWDVLLVSDGVYFSMDSVGGVGQALYMDMNVSSNSDLTPGTYNFANQRAAGTFVNASALVAYDFASDNGVEYYLNVAVPGGPIVVKKTGLDYEFEASFNANRDTTATNYPVSGYYKGRLNMLDFSMLRTSEKKEIKEKLAEFLSR